MIYFSRRNGLLTFIHLSSIVDMHWVPLMDDPEKFSVLFGGLEHFGAV